MAICEVDSYLINVSGGDCVVLRPRTTPRDQRTFQKAILVNGRRFKQKQRVINDFDSISQECAL